MMLGMTAQAASKTVATIGSKKYTSLEQAFKAVKNGQTIKLMANVKTGKTFVLNRNVKVTLNLNKYKITSTDSSVTMDAEKIAGVIRVKKGTLILKNGTVAGDCVKVEKGAKLTVQSGTYYQIVNLGTTAINNATITNKKYAGILQFGGKLTVKKATVKSNGHAVYVIGGTAVINGGTFGKVKNSEHYPVVWVEKAGILRVNGGTFNGGTATWALANEGKTTINGGTFKAASKDTVVTDSTLTIKGGKLQNTSSDCVALYCEDGSSTTISGGTFSSKNASAIHFDVTKQNSMTVFNLKNAQIKGGSATPVLWYGYNTSKKISIASKYENLIFYAGGESTS